MPDTAELHLKVSGALLRDCSSRQLSELLGDVAVAEMRRRDKPHLFKRGGKWRFKLRSWSSPYCLWPATFESTSDYLRRLRERGLA
jgi:hypothetical protein